MKRLLKQRWKFRFCLWHPIRLPLKNFLLGHNHVMTVHTFVILPIIVFSFFLIFYRREWKQEKLLVFLFIINYVLSFWYALWFNVIWIPLKENISFLNTFNFARFHFLRPLIIYFSFGLSLRYLWERQFRKLVYFALIGQLIVLMPFNEEIHYRIIHHTPSFKEFFAEEQFLVCGIHRSRQVHIPYGQYRSSSGHPPIQRVLYSGYIQ